MNSRDTYDCLMCYFNHSDWIDFIEKYWPEILISGIFPKYLKEKVLLGFLCDSDIMEGTELIDNLKYLGIKYECFGKPHHSGFISIEKQDFNLLKLCVNSNQKFEHYDMNEFYEYLKKYSLIRK